MLSGHEGFPPGICLRPQSRAASHTLEAATGKLVYWDHERRLYAYANRDRSKPLRRMIDIKVPMRITMWSGKSVLLRTGHQGQSRPQ